MSRTVQEVAEDLTDIEGKPVTPKQVRELIRIGVLPAYKTEFYVPGPRPRGFSPWVLEDSDCTNLYDKLLPSHLDYPDGVAEYPNLVALVKAFKAMVRGERRDSPRPAAK